MPILIEGAEEHNLRGVDVEIPDGLTVVTGVSGSGKTSLVFDTLYHEAQRRFLDVFSVEAAGTRLLPAKVRAVTGLGPAIAVGQNLLNRNPASTVATASGLHPFLRLLFSRFGVRHCSRCGAAVGVRTEDEVVASALERAAHGSCTVVAPLLRDAAGSHRTLLRALRDEFGRDHVLVDGRPWDGHPLPHGAGHDVSVVMGELDDGASAADARMLVQAVTETGATAVTLQGPDGNVDFATAPVCIRCGAWFPTLTPVHFHQPCPHCKGAGCDRCRQTGLHPEAAAVLWEERRLPQLLSLTVEETGLLFRGAPAETASPRLRDEIERRLTALAQVGLGYLALDRPAPTLSRGEAQRLRLAVALTGRLEDLLHVLDEPTIGQHPADVARLLPALRQLAGPVVFVEHDRTAAAEADWVIDLGPGAGSEGGTVVFSGPPSALWQAATATGRYFSGRERVRTPALRPPPEDFLRLRGCRVHNLDDVDAEVPVRRLTAVTGVSGSGKTTLVEEVLVASLQAKRPVGCREVEGPWLKPVPVDQAPIGRNPRSNPATYTKLADVIRDLFAVRTGLSGSHFSFNRPEGACPQCRGIGAVEVQMRYLPSTWITCADCGGLRFSDEVLLHRVSLGGRPLTIAELLALPVAEAAKLFEAEKDIPASDRRAALGVLQALEDVGLGYVTLGQPSPTLSGGEAQRVKLAKCLGRRLVRDSLLVLDEPTTGLHPQDVAGLLTVLDRLVRRGATVVVVEHNTDLIRAADWVVDLGPGSGPHGGRVIYSGAAVGLPDAAESATGRALRREGEVRPARRRRPTVRNAAVIEVRGARAHNLAAVDVNFPKGALTVVTGVSGSGKSSLVSEVLEAEARRRYLETLSLYERQGTHEGPEAPVESVTGLGVTALVEPERRLRNQRATVGTTTDLSHYLAALLAALGRRRCLECGAEMERRGEWVCPACRSTAPTAEPRHFSPQTYAAACLTCHGVGTLQTPRPDKLIVHPELPLCGGAMHSPGFFPQGYLCQPGNGGHDMVQALAARYEFDPERTPWVEMTPPARHAFLFGDPEPLEVHHRGRSGRESTGRHPFPGFYGWIRDWDVGGTYTDTEPCPACGGKRLRPEYLAVRLAGHDPHELSLLPLERLLPALEPLDGEAAGFVRSAWKTACRRLRFLLQVGLGYLHLGRPAGTLSAGEAQRLRLAGLLGGDLTSLTVLADEPTRGMHPSEVRALVTALRQIRDEGNTVIVVEHDPEIIEAADHLIDMGPGAGVSGGRVVAQGSPEQVAAADTVTGDWLRGERLPLLPDRRRRPSAWLTVRGARGNNLRGETVAFPLGVLAGVCGVSGSGKSTLVVDTIGRTLAPRKQTTSVAYEAIDPEPHDAIEGAPRRTIMVDQVRSGMTSPAAYLGLTGLLETLFAESEAAQALPTGESAKGSSPFRRCSACKGRSIVTVDMGFLPDLHLPCEACAGSGFAPETWEVRVAGLALPEALSLTIDEAYDRFRDEPSLERLLAGAREVGLGYLVLRQPGHALSGGEVQRLKIARELCRATKVSTLYILDEPTVGQHLEDVARLVGVLQRLVDAGHSVLVVEHHPHLLAACDRLIELGPGGGPEGGRVVGEGSPEELAAGETPTAPYLRQVLGTRR